MISSVLKENTKQAHQALEAVVIREIKAIRNKEDYVRLLHKFYGFHSPLEQLYDGFFNDSIIPFYNNRRKADLILQDLENLGVDKAGIGFTDDLPAIDSTAAAFGSYYVLEGSTQGGSIVAGMLIKHAGLTPDTTAFFYGYGDNSKEMWQSFKDKMDSYFPDDTLHKEVITAANETFAKFKEWMVR